MTKYELGIVIPTYNEKDNIEGLLNQISQVINQAKIKSVLLVMDDNSPDGTSQIVHNLIGKLQSEFFELRLKTRPGKMGLASAYIQGFEELKSECEYLQSMDADFSHQPKYLPVLLNKIKEGSDLVIGSRNIQGGGVEGWGPSRLFVSKMGSLYSKTILMTNINDFTGGFNLYRTNMLEKLGLESIKAEGYLFQIEMKYRISKLGGKVVEIPIWFIDRQHGKSKFTRKIMIEAFVGVIGLKINI